MDVRNGNSSYVTLIYKECLIGMRHSFFILLFCIIGLCTNAQSIIKHIGVSYNFEYAEKAIQYLASKDQSMIKEMAGLDGAKHIFGHATFYGNINKEVKIEEFLNDLLSKIPSDEVSIEKYKRNLEYAKEQIAKPNLPAKVCLDYLPKGYQFDCSLYITIGYDLGVGFNGNSSINLAHPYYVKRISEIKYFSIHELHHAAFMDLKNNQKPSFDITTYAEMYRIICFYTHLEALGTYSPLALRRSENAMNADRDYIALQNQQLMEQFEKEYFEIIDHFKSEPDKIITNADWEMIAPLSDGKRLWYRVGALMAEKIDKELGRERLNSLLTEDPQEFINTYLSIRD